MNSYSGSCHCGRVKFQIKTDDIFKDVYRCDCSLCKKKAILMKAEQKDQFKVIAGHNDLLSYKWNKQIAEHFFCGNCGVYTHHKRRRDPNQICINFACLDDLDMPSESAIGIANGSEHD